MLLIHLLKGSRVLCHDSYIMPVSKWSGTELKHETWCRVEITYLSETARPIVMHFFLYLLDIR